MPTEAFFCHFRGLPPLAGFPLDRLPGFLSGWNGRGPLWGRVRPVGQGWNGRPTCWPVGLAYPSVLFPHVLLPSSSHTHTFQGWGEPETPRTPGQGLPTFSKVGSTSRFLGWRRALCRCVGTSGMGSTSLSQRGGSAHLGSLSLPPSSGATTGERGSCCGVHSPLPTRSFAHCDFALPPTHTRSGQRAPQEAPLGSGSCLS